MMTPSPHIYDNVREQFKILLELFTIHFQPPLSFEINSQEKTRSSEP
jgi:hypothetical protein